VIAYIRREQAADPLALIHPLATDKGSGQLQVVRGVNFDLALFLAQLTGAVIYSECDGGTKPACVGVSLRLRQILSAQWGAKSVVND